MNQKEGERDGTHHHKNTSVRIFLGSSLVSILSFGKADCQLHEAT